MDELHDGEIIWIMSVSYSTHQKPVPYVERCVVLDAENRVVRRRFSNGHEGVKVLDAITMAVVSVYRCEAEAWQAAAAALSRGAADLTAVAADCSQRAAACVVGEAVPA
jgi:hypothetical protein